MDLTTEKHWQQLFRHVVVEMFLRGQTPVPHNFDPTVKKAVLFPDKELCEQAADAIKKVQIPGPILVKYGKAEHIRALYERGEVYMPPASLYGEPEHNQAVHDQELTLSHYAAVASDEGYFMFVPIEMRCKNPMLVFCHCFVLPMPNGMKLLALSQ